tara:strand:- start:2920 stop:3141 length:222 start_codon:yes stop_codon:yes gene_type:complete
MQINVASENLLPTFIAAGFLVFPFHAKLAEARQMGRIDWFNPDTSRPAREGTEEISRNADKGNAATPGSQFQF